MRQSASLSLAAGVGLLGLLFAADVIGGQGTLLAALFGLSALVASLAASPRQTLGVTVLATALAVIAVLINTRYSGNQDVIRVVAVALTGGLATWTAQLRERLVAGAERQRLLARATEVMADPPEVRRMLERVVATIVPDFADAGTIDLLDGDRRLERVAALHADPARVDRLRALPPPPVERL